MNIRTTLVAAAAVITLVAASGCAVTRGQEGVGAYVDDASITTAVKSRFVGDPGVGTASIGVDTLNGTVMLSGFAKSTTERANAEALTWKVAGVKSVKNEIAVRP